MNSNGSQRKLIWVSTILVLVLMRLTSESAELKGTVIAVQGDDVTVKVESAGALQPAVGDILNIMERANEEGNALGIPGKWIITEVIGDIVKAEGENLLKGLRPKVNMQAFIHIPPGSVHAGEVPADVEKKSHPAAKGKVIMTKGKDVTIQLEKGQPQASVGDVVELSFTAGGEVIPVGKWRVSVVKENGNVEAKPFEPKGEPNIDMDALVFTSTLEKSESVKSKKGLEQNLDAGVAPVTDEKPVKKESEPITVEEELALYSRTDATRDFLALGKTVKSEYGKVQIYSDKIEMKATGGEKGYCTLKLSNDILSSFHASLKVSVDITRHDWFEVRLVYSPEVSNPRISDSITVGLVQLGGKIGFLKSKPNYLNWIQARRNFKNKDSHEIFKKVLPNSNSNPTPGTLELIKANNRCWVFWNGEEMGYWEESVISKGHLWVILYPLTKGKVTAVFENIQIDSLHRK